jgi:hypothetical protein
MQIQNKSELEELNKNVLTHMIKQLHQIYNQQGELPKENKFLPLITPSIQQTSFTSMQGYMGKEAERASKQEQFNSAFEERQKQYESLFSKPILPEIDFSEKKDDKPISNMEELVQQHLKERETEIQNYLTTNKVLPENNLHQPKIDSAPQNHDLFKSVTNNVGGDSNSGHNASNDVKSENIIIKENNTNINKV